MSSTWGNMLLLPVFLPVCAVFAAPGDGPSPARTRTTSAPVTTVLNPAGAPKVLIVPDKPRKAVAASPVPKNPPDPEAAVFDRPTMKRRLKLGTKIQKVTFLQDDSQVSMITKIYVLKHARAADLDPFIRSAVIRYDSVSSVLPWADFKNHRELLVVTTGQDMMPYVDAMIRVLDRPGKVNEYDSMVYGTGIACGVYRPRFRAASSMMDIMTGILIYSGEDQARIRLDEKNNIFYFKDSPFRVRLLKEKLAWLDREIPQISLEFKIYEIRDSDLKDIGIDYLAWKNGPGLNLFKAGYEALNVDMAETLIQQASQIGVDLFGNLSASFGGMYTAPAFDFSFIRILQQNGRSVINSTAYVTVSNEPNAEFKVNFAPEYQNILKDDKHRTSVSVGGDATLTATVSDTVITGGPKGVVNFTYSLNGSNVVERNNQGSEISEKTSTSASVSLGFGHEAVIADWTRSSDVEQTIGVPFLCELPILKYIFGTTTNNTEVTHYFVTARAMPLNIHTDMKPGMVAEFDELVRKQAGKAAKK